MAVDRLTYSISVDNRVISVWSLEAHTMGHPMNIMTYPVLDLAVDALCSHLSLFHNPQKSVSAKHSTNRFLLGQRIIPSSLVPRRNLTIWCTACVCNSLGCLQKRAH